jgi:hypothetical protein
MREKMSEPLINLISLIKPDESEKIDRTNKTNKTNTKALRLNYQPSASDRFCANCRRSNKDNCPLLKIQVTEDYCCDGWKLQGEPREWTVSIGMTGEKVYLNIKNCGRFLSHADIIPTNIEKGILCVLDLITSEEGCPDELVNETPGKISGKIFIDWCNYREIKYSETKNE